MKPDGTASHFRFITRFNRRRHLDGHGLPVDNLIYRWGRTGFDLGDAPEAACRGRCVGLVNHRIKQNS